MTVRILIGDVREQLRLLPADHFDCVVTSPPYWGLRDYGTARWEGGLPDCDHSYFAGGNGPASAKQVTSQGTQKFQYKGVCKKCSAVRIDHQIGLERTLGEHLAVMVDVFSEVRRVMKPTATLWLNYGDCYASSPNGRSAADTKAAGNDDRTFRDKPFSTVGAIYCPDGGAKGSSGDRSGKTKNLRNHGDAEPVPQGRVVAGGTLKPKDLCMIPNRLAIALQEAGWWVRSEIIWHKPNPMPESIKDRPGSSHEKVWLLSKSSRYFYDYEAVRQPLTSASVARLGQDVESQEGSDRANGGAKTNGKMKAVKFGGNKYEGGDNRTYSGNEWKPRGKALTSPRNDGNAWNENNGRGFIPTAEGANLRNVWTIATAAFSEAHFATFPPELAERCIKAGCPAGGHVLDPFGGAGTTGLVADRLQRHATLIELNTEYAALARRRIDGDAPLFAESAQ